MKTLISPKGYNDDVTILGCSTNPPETNDGCDCLVGCYCGPNEPCNQQ